MRNNIFVAGDIFAAMAPVFAFDFDFVEEEVVGWLEGHELNVTAAEGALVLAGVSALTADDGVTLTALQRAHRDLVTRKTEDQLHKVFDCFYILYSG
jgi:hypothetical protein